MYFGNLPLSSLSYICQKTLYVQKNSKCQTFLFLFLFGHRFLTYYDSLKFACGSHEAIERLDNFLCHWKPFSMLVRSAAVHSFYKFTHFLRHASGAVEILLFKFPYNLVLHCPVGKIRDGCSEKVCKVQKQENEKKT